MKDNYVKLAGFKPSDIKYMIIPETGRSVEQEMRSAATRMVGYIQEAIDAYYSSYSPVIYQRTGSLKSSVLMSDIGDVTYSGSKARVTITPNTWVWHSSWPAFCRGYAFSGLHLHLSNAFRLIDEGWRVSNGSHASIYRFGYYEGFHFMNRAIGKFNSNNPLGIEVKY